MTRLAISNIAWLPAEQAEVFAFLRDAGVTGLEIAPGLTFPDEADPFRPSAGAVAAFADTLAAHGLTLVSMQSLLFGVQDAQLFGPPPARAAFVAGVGRAIELAAQIGVPNLVLGSPTNRAIPPDMPRGQADAIARDTFRELGERCVAAGTRLALEPSPAAYRTNFMTDVAEAAAVVRQVDHPGVTLNFDLGAVAMNGESAGVGALFAQVADITSHVHVSEPQLAPAPADAAALERAVRPILAHGYGGWFSIEMRRDAADAPGAVRTCVQRARAAIDAVAA